MSNIKKDISFITAACKAAENKLLGRDRIRRMTEAASEKEAISVLKETAFGGTEFNEGDLLIKSEEERTLSFAREYAPDDACLSYFLLPYDFYNAEAVVKCLFNELPTEKYVGVCGLFTVPELVSVCRADENPDETTKQLLSKMPALLISAIKDGQKVLQEGGNGVDTGVIFKRAEFACLLKECKHLYLKKMIKSKMNAIDISVCLRAGDEDVARGQLVGGGLTEEQITALCAKDERAVAVAFADSELKELAIKSVKAACAYRPLVELEKEINGGAVKRMYDGRFTEQEGTLPYVAYVLRRQYEIACVRTILSGKTNGLDGERIAERLKTL